jgi:hypothetical protein
MRAREGRTARRSALPADDRLDDQAMIIHKLEMQVSMAKNKSTLPDKYYGCQDADELLNYIYANSLLAFSSRLLSLLTAPAFQLVAEALGHKYKESLAPWGKAQAGAHPVDDQGHPGAGQDLHRPCAPRRPPAGAQAHDYYRVQAGDAEEGGTNGSSGEDDV